MFTLKQKTYLLELARQTLVHYFETGDILSVDISQVDSALTQKLGTFVTLTKNGELRGCIGHNEPMQAIYKDVIDNALSASFKDNRFEVLQESELEDLHIEISILTEPKKIEYSLVKNLLNSLHSSEDGVLIKKGHNSATYLPQVWEELSNKEEFLTSLCLKAGLRPDVWKTGDLEVYTYQAEVFFE